jgi:MYXO-CTERM domain-containing protein
MGVAPRRAVLGGGISVGAGLVTALISTPALAADACIERLDNGVDLTGWTRSTTNHHGPGEGWTVEEGAITGRQTTGQQGGILMTAKRYRDVEVTFEVKIDWGCDSGVFFRTTAGDRAYQVNVDHLEGGGIGTIYGESFTTELRALDFTLTNQGKTAIAGAGCTPLFDLSRWPTMWDPAAFNEIRTRVEGNPPHIQTWIAGVKVTDFTDARVRSELDAAGPLAIQVHSGARWASGGAVRFRNIRVRDLTAPCEGAADGGTGSAGTNTMDATANADPSAPCGSSTGTKSQGCACALAAPPSTTASALAVLAAALVLRRRRHAR